MKALILVFLLLLSSYAVEDHQVLMDSISQHAIRIGSGPNTTYTFVDPLCPKSQLFIELINEREDLKEKTSYYIFLYRLRMFDSDELIQYIYQSEDPLTALKEIMIYEDFDALEDFTVNQNTLDIIHNISKVAKLLEMKRRPYLLIFNEGSSYCRVSEGTAPCLEENDF